MFTSPLRDAWLVEALDNETISLSRAAAAIRKTDSAPGGAAIASAKAVLRSQLEKQPGKPHAEAAEQLELSLRQVDGALVAEGVSKKYRVRGHIVDQKLTLKVERAAKSIGTHS